jgi:histidine triad (HIT) family protein
MRDCVFCDIAAGRAGATRLLYEDDRTVAFLDHTAVTEGHTLVIPKQHAADLWEITEDDAAAVMRTAHKMARRIREILNPAGLTLFQANRPAGWQDVFHLHVHVVPRYPDDQLTRPWVASVKPAGTLRAARQKLALPQCQ